LPEDRITGNFIRISIGKHAIDTTWYGVLRQLFTDNFTHLDCGVPAPSADSVAAAGTYWLLAEGNGKEETGLQSSE